MGTMGLAGGKVLQRDGGKNSGERERLLLLARACAENQPATVVYRDVQRRRTQRQVSVLGLGWRPEGWLYLAECHLRSGVRLFRLDRTDEVALGARMGTDSPNHFDPRAFASAALQEDRRPALLVPVTLEPPLSDLARVFFPQAVIEERGPRTRICHVPVTRPGAMAQLVRTLGPGAYIGEYCTNPAIVAGRATSS